MKRFVLAVLLLVSAFATPANATGFLFGRAPIVQFRSPFFFNGRSNFNNGFQQGFRAGQVQQFRNNQFHNGFQQGFRAGQFQQFRFSH